MKRNKWGSNQYQAKKKTYTKEWLSIFGIAVVVCYTGKLASQDIFGRIKTAWAEETSIISPLPEVPTTKEPYPVYFEDSRIKKLEMYLESKNSPLSPYSESIITLSDKWGIDYTLIPSVAGKESSFGKAIKEDSHNAWGIMTWDENNVRSIRKFSSWDESIAYVAKMLGTKYKDNMLQGIQENYCPKSECSGTWVSDIEGFSKDIINQEDVEQL